MSFIDLLKSRGSNPKKIGFLDWIWMGNPNPNPNPKIQKIQNPNPNPNPKIQKNPNPNPKIHFFWILRNQNSRKMIFFKYLNMFYLKKVYLKLFS